MITVLIIDDSISDRTLYRVWLEKESEGKFKTIEAGNGAEVYSAFVKHSPNCIILDFMMPDKDGLEVLKDIKSTHGVIPPILFVTAAGNEEVEIKAMKLGANGYLNKKN